ncbi:ankyrin repeat domain-containing protein [Dasania marina]|uniref:ankyrin repeat domain-containing protein n=1 Tax=Dasania marina TaxID=471499 RepID=UPI00037263EE|nr:ankyrin repeat domain-containing protein [Dasania marina]
MNQTNLALQYRSIPAGVIQTSLDNFSGRCYVPYWSLMNNEDLHFPFMQGSVTGSIFAAEVIESFRKHSAFIPLRRAELAIRRNEALDCLAQQSLYLDQPEYILQPETWPQGLLNLAVVYGNSAAVEYLVQQYEVNPADGLMAAIAEQQIGMVYLLVKLGASINEPLPEGAGWPLDFALRVDKPSVELVRLLLKLGADMHVRDKRGNNAQYYAKKSSRRVRAAMCELLGQTMESFNNKELTMLDAEQLADQKYSAECISQLGQKLLGFIATGISREDRDSLDELVQPLIAEASELAFGYLLQAFKKECGVDRGAALSRPSPVAEALFHVNFQVPENIQGYIEVAQISYAHRGAYRWRAIAVLGQMNNQAAQEGLRHLVPDIQQGVLSRYKQGKPAFLKSETIEDQEDVLGLTAKPINNAGYLLEWLPCADMELAFELSQAFSKTSALLKRLDNIDEAFAANEQQALLASLLQERRIDLPARTPTRRDNVWCLFFTDEIPSYEWHVLVHYNTVMAIAWLVYLYTSKPEWIEGVVNDDIYVGDIVKMPANRRRQASFKQEKLALIIDNGLSKLDSWKLVSRRHGDIFTLESVELLRAAGVEEYLKQHGDSRRCIRFNTMWCNILEQFRTQSQQPEPICLSASSPMIGMISMRGEVDVTDRIKALVRTENA